MFGKNSQSKRKEVSKKKDRNYLQCGVDNVVLMKTKKEDKNEKR
jgi:hypothetical protein